MHEHWSHKMKRSNSMSNKKINEWYLSGIKNGAIGGKLQEEEFFIIFDRK